MPALGILQLTGIDDRPVYVGISDIKYGVRVNGHTVLANYNQLEPYLVQEDLAAVQSLSKRQFFQFSTRDNDYLISKNLVSDAYVLPDGRLRLRIKDNKEFLTSREQASVVLPEMLFIPFQFGSGNIVGTGDTPGSLPGGAADGDMFFIRDATPDVPDNGPGKNWGLYLWDGSWKVVSAYQSLFFEPATADGTRSGVTVGQIGAGTDVAALRGLTNTQLWEKMLYGPLLPEVVRLQSLDVDYEPAGPQVVEVGEPVDLEVQGIFDPGLIRSGNGTTQALKGDITTVEVRDLDDSPISVTPAGNTFSVIVPAKLSDPGRGRVRAIVGYGAGQGDYFDGDGNVVTNLDGDRAGGSISAFSPYLVATYRVFYGQNGTAPSSSADIRALSSKLLGEDNSLRFQVQALAGSTDFYVYVPQGEWVEVFNERMVNITSGFTRDSVIVNLPDGTSVPYDRLVYPRGPGMQDEVWQYRIGQEVSAIGVLNDLGDVVVQGPVLGELLGYNGSFWTNQNIADAIILGLDDLVDVEAPAPGLGDVVYYDGNSWINTPIGTIAPVPALDDLTDVTAPTPGTGDVVYYDGNSWINTPIGTIAPVPALDDLTDVTAPTPGTGDVVYYDGNSWINTPIGTIAPVPALDDLTDVTAPAPVLGDVVYYDGNSWINTPIGTIAPVPALDDLTDVTAPTPGTGDVVYYDGNSWINTPIGTIAPVPALDDLTDVTAPSPGSGDVVYYDGNSWINTPIGTIAPVPALDDLTDVTAPTPALRDVVYYDGNSWININIDSLDLGLPDAPADGSFYGRKDNNWEVLPSDKWLATELPAGDVTINGNGNKLELNNAEFVVRPTGASISATANTFSVNIAGGSDLLISDTLARVQAATGTAIIAGDVVSVKTDIWQKFEGGVGGTLEYEMPSGVVPQAGQLLGATANGVLGFVSPTWLKTELEGGSDVAINADSRTLQIALATVDLESKSGSTTNGRLVFDPLGEALLYGKNVVSVSSDAIVVIDAPNVTLRTNKLVRENASGIYSYELTASSPPSSSSWSNAALVTEPGWNGLVGWREVLRMDPISDIDPDTVWNDLGVRSVRPMAGSGNPTDDGGLLSFGGNSMPDPMQLHWGGNGALNYRTKTSGGQVSGWWKIYTERSGVPWSAITGAPDSLWEESSPGILIPKSLPGAVQQLRSIAFQTKSNGNRYGIYFGAIGEAVDNSVAPTSDDMIITNREANGDMIFVTSGSSGGTSGEVERGRIWSTGRIKFNAGTSQNFESRGDFNYVTGRRRVYLRTEESSSFIRMSSAQIQIADAGDSTLYSLAQNSPTKQYQVMRSVNGSTIPVWGTLPQLGSQNDGAWHGASTANSSTNSYGFGAGYISNNAGLTGWNHVWTSQTGGGRGFQIAIRDSGARGIKWRLNYGGWQDWQGFSVQTKVVAKTTDVLGSVSITASDLGVSTINSVISVCQSRDVSIYFTAFVVNFYATDTQIVIFYNLDGGTNANKLIYTHVAFLGV